MPITKKAYVANFATTFAVEAQQDDPVIEMELESSPQLCGVSECLTVGWLARMQRICMDEVLEEGAFEEAELRWMLVQPWNEPEAGRPNLVMSLVEHSTGEETARLCVQQLPLN